MGPDLCIIMILNNTLFYWIYNHPVIQRKVTTTIRTLLTLRDQSKKLGQYTGER